MALDSVVVNLAVRPAEHHVADFIAGEEVVWEAEFNRAGRVETGEVLRRQPDVQRAEGALQLLHLARTDERDDGRAVRLLLGQHPGSRRL